jgi:ABC-type polysaccharide/polyol phosphate transport system ATPase subunit
VSWESSAASDSARAGAAISVHGLGKRFGDRVAFEDVSFEIAHGEVFGFLGPNGAGKTTTVRTLGTLISNVSLTCTRYRSLALGSNVRCGRSTSLSAPTMRAAPCPRAYASGLPLPERC